jgi:hypothetical protein
MQLKVFIAFVFVTLAAATPPAPPAPTAPPEVIDSHARNLESALDDVLSVVAEGLTSPDIPSGF